MAKIDQFKPGDRVRLARYNKEDPNWHPTEEREMQVGEEFEVLRIANGKLWYSVPWHIFTENTLLPEFAELASGSSQRFEEIELESLAYGGIGVCYIKGR